MSRLSASFGNPKTFSECSDPEGGRKYATQSVVRGEATLLIENFLNFLSAMEWEKVLVGMTLSVQIPIKQGAADRTSDT